MTTPQHDPPPNGGLAAKLARLSRLPEDLGVAAPKPTIDLSLAVPPSPGEKCPWCERHMAPTALEVWLDRNQLGFSGLGERLFDHPEIVAWSEDHGGWRFRITKNLLWRLNHQAPGWTPKESTRGAPVQRALLDLTGLEVEDLQNERPTTGGYACGDRRYQERVAKGTQCPTL